MLLRFMSRYYRILYIIFVLKTSSAKDFESLSTYVFINSFETYMYLLIYFNFSLPIIYQLVSIFKTYTKLPYYIYTLYQLVFILPQICYQILPIILNIINKNPYAFPEIV